MNRPKINEIFSYEYPRGRIDNLTMKVQSDIHKQIVELLNNLKFSEEIIEKFDLDFTKFDGYLFGYSKKMKVHLFSSDGEITLVFDSKVRKEKLISEIEKFFQIF
jgi:hypothetical protein